MLGPCVRTRERCRPSARRRPAACWRNQSAMDYPKLDKVRQSATPLQLDVVEAFAAGRLSRREFIQRGTVVGLSIGVDQRGHRGLRLGEHRPQRGRSRRAPAPPRRPAASAAPRPPRPAARSGSPSSARCRSTRSPWRTSAATASPPSRSSSCARSTQDGSDIAPGPGRVSGRRTRTARSGRSSSARASSGRTASPFTVGRRRRHDGAPRRGRQLRPEGRPRAGRRGRHRRRTR